MSRLRFICCSITLLFVACSGQEQQQTTKREAVVERATADIRVENVGFSTPESVLHDPAADVYLVANINGSPIGVDGNGFISRLAPDGAVIDVKWIDGQNDGVELDAPKGMAIVGDTLYVADISVVRRFNRDSGEYLGAIEVSGGTFVNDLAATRAGRVIVSDTGVAFTDSGTKDTGSAAVYVIDTDGDLATVAEGDTLDRPNGVVDSTAHDGIVVAPLGTNVIYLLDEDGERYDVAELPNGFLDGIVETGDGQILVSSWAGSAIYQVSPSGEVTTVADNLPAPADIGYDAVRSRLLVPLFNDNAVIIKPVE